MIKKFLISSFIFCSILTIAQEGSASKYSLYGIGETRFNGNVESRTMGGISMIPDSTRINFQNPAGFAYLKWTNFTIGASTSETKQKTTNAAAISKRTTFDYLALGIPLGKFGAGFGLIPFSSVGYKTQKKNVDDSKNSTRIDGSGGLNRVFLGTGYSITPSLSFGIQAYYNFGKIQTNHVVFNPSVIETTLGSREYNVTDLTGLNLTIGAMYQLKLKEKLTLFSSLYYTPKSNLTSQNQQTFSTVSVNQFFEYTDIDLFDTENNNSSIQMPQKWSLGIGVGDAKKWVVGLDVILQETNKSFAYNNLFANTSYTKYQRFGFGGYFTPSTKPFMSYIKRMTYRAGFVYEKTGIIVNNTEIDDIGMTLGFGLPVKGSLSNLNLGFEFGKKGTTKNNLVQENYLLLNIGFSLNDKWFVKSKYR